MLLAASLAVVLGGALGDPAAALAGVRPASW